MARTNTALEAALQGRSPAQQKVIRYFMAPDGCLSKNISDEEYDKLVWDKINTLDLKRRALARTGLEESQVTEIPPVEFRHWHFGKTALYKRGIDGSFRSSVYQVSWLFFSGNFVHVYQCTIKMNDNEKEERVEKYSLRDISGFSVSLEHEETECREPGALNAASGAGITRHVFYVITPEGKFGCAMVHNDETAGKIQAMNAKLREKNGRSKAPLVFSE
ncbi:MAG: hypothetical protein LBK02_08825 [Treponema sp.]|jgi:hypothetical protein|nr:hypothetical protein [Treponema sp.]